jgi:hypothetical protein
MHTPGERRRRAASQSQGLISFVITTLGALARSRLIELDALSAHVMRVSLYIYSRACSFSRSSFSRNAHSDTMKLKCIINAPTLRCARDTFYVHASILGNLAFALFERHYLWGCVFILIIIYAAPRGGDNQSAAQIKWYWYLALGRGRLWETLSSGFGVKHNINIRSKWFNGRVKLISQRELLSEPLNTLE